MQPSSVPKAKINSTAPANSPDALDTFGNSLNTTDDIDAMLASFAPPKQPSELQIIEKRYAPRYRVKWKAEVVTDDKSTYQGFINDISTVGASICLNTSLHTTKCTLYSALYESDRRTLRNADVHLDSAPA
jgi:hypothetical protein